MKKQSRIMTKTPFMVVWWVLVVTSARHVESFQHLSALERMRNPRGGSIQDDNAKNTAVAMTTNQPDNPNHNNNNNNNSNNNTDVSQGQNIILAPVSAFVRALFRGMTIPFPTLRKLTTVPGSVSTDKTAKETTTTSMGFSVREALLGIAAYLVLGVVSYSSTIIKSQGVPFSFVDALYFSVVTFTTVGYGDICPQTVAGKLFTVLFGFAGIAVLGIAIATIGSKLLQTETEMMAAANAAGRQHLLKFWNRVARDKNSNNKSMSDMKDDINDESSSSSSSAEKMTLFSAGRPLVQFICQSIPAVLVLILGGLIMGKIEGWSVIDSIYFAFITAGTLGYGDFSPGSRNGRLWAIIFIPLSVATAGEILGGVANWLMERRQDQFYQSLLDAEVDMEKLLEMDTSRNGKVSREEYVEFMLKKMQLVDEEQFEELHAAFDRLDADGGGYLDQKDLRLLLKKAQVTPPPPPPPPPTATN